jgi:hypothetical protein
MISIRLGMANLPTSLRQRTHRLFSFQGGRWLLCLLGVAVTLNIMAATNGLLQLPSEHSRYFVDRNGKAVYLTGAHTWANLVDGWLSNGVNDPSPAPFDFDAYLAYLEGHNHNFIRLWTQHMTRTDFSAEAGLPSGSKVYYSTPSPWQRIGPELALDGELKFDLSAFDQSYFDRLRERVVAAQERGIYVSIMLFEGYALRLKNAELGWNFHPFHPGNNINGIDGDPNKDGYGSETHTLQVSAIHDLQLAYLRKVVDTVNDLDNVLYEISNEEGNRMGGTATRDWQYSMMEALRDYQATKPQQHPVIISCIYDENGEGVNAWLNESSAEAIAPWGPANSGEERLDVDPPATAAGKVYFADTDHIWGVGGNPDWVWKCFLRGYNPLYMDGWNNPDFRHELRAETNAAMGYTRAVADRVNLASLSPQGSLSTTGYCLADRGIEYLVYQPDSVPFSVTLTAANYDYEWINPTTGETILTGTLIASEGGQTFTPPLARASVLYLKIVALVDDTFEEGSIIFNNAGVGDGWYQGVFNGGISPTERAGSFIGSIGTEYGLSAIQGRDTFPVWTENGTTVTWTIESMEVNTPHKYGHYFAYCWEMGLVSANATRSGSAWNMSGPNKKGGFYIQVGKSNAWSQAEIWVTISNKHYSGEEGTSGYYTPTQVSTAPGGIGPVFNASFPIQVTAHLSSQGWRVSTNQKGLAPLSGNWTTSLQTVNNDASITDEFANGVFIFTAARNHGIDGSGLAYTPNTGRMGRITVAPSADPTEAFDWDHGAIEMGNGWQYLPWFGTYYTFSNHWMWHATHGYLYPSSSPTAGATFLYAPDMKWLWIGRDTWPWVYRYEDGVWLWYAGSDADGRYFYNAGLGEWETWSGA